jgi:SAM-dependent methyltransferase
MKNRKMEAEFDLLADDYYEQHKQNISASGEGPEYFSEYKIKDLASWMNKRKVSEKLSILDFGSGIGNSIPYFRKYFKNAHLTCADVSQKSLEISKERYPGNEDYLKIESNFNKNIIKKDIIFSACVFHHIPHDEHSFWLSELYRVASDDGMLVIYEHNPLNPLTVKAVNTCPLDVNAELITARKLKKTMEESGWENIKIHYKVFFPAFLSFLRPVEPCLAWFCVGAQYRISGFKNCKKKS